MKPELTNEEIKSLVRYWYSNCTNLDELIRETVKRATVKLPESPRWIPVDERMPTIKDSIGLYIVWTMPMGDIVVRLWDHQFGGTWKPVAWYPLTPYMLTPEEIEEQEFQKWWKEWKKECKNNTYPCEGLAKFMWKSISKTLNKT